MFGTFKLMGAQTADCVTYALQKGFTRIDTAQIYQNEGFVGDAVIQHEQSTANTVFVQTKVSPRASDSAENVASSIRSSLAALKRHRIDRLLVHWPGTARVKHDSSENLRNRHITWEVMSARQ